MKIYKPPQELLDLDLVLKYDTEKKPILSDVEKRQINYGRAKIMRGEASNLDQNLMGKINYTNLIIKTENWQPKFPIEYSNQERKANGNII